MIKGFFIDLLCESRNTLTFLLYYGIILIVERDKYEKNFINKYSGIYYR